MKTLIVLVLGLLAVGCGKPEKPLEPSQLPAEPPPANSPPTPTGQNTTKAKPVKELTLEDRVVGEYEYKSDKNTYRWVFLDNGILESYTNGKNQVEAKWSIVNKEIHVDYGIFKIFAYRINEDKSITQVAAIEDGKRTDLSKEDQWTYEKIK